MNGHRWYAPKRLPWFRFCIVCGLLALKNAVTEKAIKKGCCREDE